LGKGLSQGWLAQQWLGNGKTILRRTKKRGIKTFTRRGGKKVSFRAEKEEKKKKLRYEAWPRRYVDGLSNKNENEKMFREFQFASFFFVCEHKMEHEALG
jgi:hypothetical protein